MALPQDVEGPVNTPPAVSDSGNRDQIRSTSPKRKRPANKFYSVRSGHCPGIYHTWAECLFQVKGFKGADFKSFTNSTDAEKYLASKNVSDSHSVDPSFNFYAVRAGRNPGIYTDWPTAQKQITGWSKPQHKCFSTRVEAQRFIDRVDSEPNSTGVYRTDDTVRSGAQSGISEPSSKKTKKADFTPYEPGANLPAGAKDGFDHFTVLERDTGKVVEKTVSQLMATKMHAAGPSAKGMLRVYTDGSSLGNGQEKTFAGIGVYFGPTDPKNISEPLPRNRVTSPKAELAAIFRALEIVPKDRDLTIVTDSQYAINCATTWYKTWQKNGWKTSNGGKVEHREIVETIRHRIEERDDMGVKTCFEWIKGHANIAENMEADKLAVNGAQEAARMVETG